MKISQKILAIFAVFIFIFSTSCVETIVLGSAATGVLVVQEKTAANTGKDMLIASKLTTVFVANGLKNPGNSIDFNVNEGRVLLTGIARNVQKANLAAELAWKVTDVKEVIDEIQLLDDDLHFRDFGKSFSDYVITAELETKLLLARRVSSINYQITTVGKIVYLLGVASNEDEMQKVLSIAAKTRGVKKVVNHIILADDHRRSHG